MNVEETLAITNPAPIDVRLFDYVDPLLDRAYLNPTAWVGADELSDDWRPVLLTGGGFDTLCGGFVYLYHMYTRKLANLNTVVHPINTVTINYGASVEAVETEMAWRQHVFFNAALDAIREIKRADEPLAFSWTPPPQYSTVRVIMPSFVVIEDANLRMMLTATDHPITWNHIVPAKPLPDNSGVPARNTRFLSMVDLYARINGYNVVLFGAQGSGPDVSVNFLRAIQQVLYHGDDAVPLAIHSPLVGELKSVGFQLVQSVGAEHLISALGFSCQTHNGWDATSNYEVPLHCGVCFRCTINNLNFKRAWMRNPLSLSSSSYVANKLKDASDA